MWLTGTFKEDDNWSDMSCLLWSSHQVNIWLFVTYKLYFFFFKLSNHCGYHLVLHVAYAGFFFF